MVVVQAEAVVLPRPAAVIRPGYVSFLMLWPILAGKEMDRERRTTLFLMYLPSQVHCSICSSRSGGAGALQMMMDNRIIR
jgi:hypothetical protein